MNGTVLVYGYFFVPSTIMTTFLSKDIQKGDGWIYPSFTWFSDPWVHDSTIYVNRSEDYQFNILLKTRVVETSTESYVFCLVKPKTTIFERGGTRPFVLT